jgi:glycerol kinase
MSGKYILALDHGTTSTRALLYDHDFQIIASARKEGSLAYRHPGWVEQDALQIWLDTLSVLSEVLLRSSINPNDIAAIGISNQRETSLLWDRHTGLPVADAIVWQSRQTSDICDAWKEQGLEEKVRHITGLRIDPYFSASKIRWLLDNVPGVKEKAEKGDLLFGTMDTWLLWKLSAGKLHITDVSNASRTMLMDLETCTWSDTLLQTFDIPKSILPEIRQTSEIYGTTSPVVFFGAEVPVAALAGDQQAALFGQMCHEPGMVKNTYGTGGFLLMNTGDTIIHSQNGLLSTAAWKINGKTSYALEGSIFVSGSLLKWLRDSLHVFDDVSLTAQMAEEAKEDSGVVIVPAFVGLGAPSWNDKAKAAVYGLSLQTGKNEMVKAALEAMAFQVQDVLLCMEKDAGRKVERLKVDGGASQNDYLLQLQADISRIPVERYSSAELTALGAASLAGLASGFWSEEDLKLQAQDEFQPEKDLQEVEKDYARWQKALSLTEQF